MGALITANQFEQLLAKGSDLVADYAFLDSWFEVGDEVDVVLTGNRATRKNFHRSDCQSEIAGVACSAYQPNRAIGIDRRGHFLDRFLARMASAAPLASAQSSRHYLQAASARVRTASKHA